MASDTEELVLSISADTRQIMNAIKRLEKDIGASAAGVEKSFARIGKGIDKSIDTTVQKRINEITGIGVAAAKEWTGALADQGKELERMRARFNPIFAVVTRYKATVTEIQTAQRLGAITTDEMTAAIQRERQATLASIAALKQRNAVLDSARRGGTSTFNTANIAAQFQDIGVTAAMGMSPLQIALQQGTQLSAVLNSMGNARSVIAGLGAAFGTLVSPVSLVTIGVVGLTAAAIQYFSTFLSGSEDSEEALKAQAELIQKVADKWGDALPSIKAYADQQRRLADQADVQGATAGVVANAWQETRARIEDARSEVANIIDLLGNMPEQQNGVVELQRAFNTLSNEVAAGKTETESLERVSRALSDLYGASQIPIVNDLATAFSDLAEQIAKADQAATIAKAEAALKDLSASLPALGTVGPVYSGGGKLIDANDVQTDRANAAKSQYQLEQERLARAARSDTKTPRRTADDRFFEDIEAIRQRTVALAEERAQLGLSYEAQQKRKIAFDLEQQALKDVREEARRKGDQDWQNAKLAPSQVQQIDEVSSAYARQADQLRKAQDQRAFFENAIYGLFTDLVPAIETGNKALDNFLNTLVEVAAQALLLGKGPFGGGGGGLIGSFLAGLGIPFFASGTNFAPGGLAVVGEKGPEIVNLPRGAKVIPNHQIAGPRVPTPVMGASAASATINMPIQINAPGADAAQLRRVEQSVRDLGRNVPKIVVGTMHSTRTRGTRA